MSLTANILILIECFLSILIIFFVVLQKSSEVEPMISTSTKSSINRGDNFLLGLIKILIFLFFLNTVSLTIINYQNKKNNISIVK